MISVMVGPGGAISLRNWSTDAESNPRAPLDLSGLEGRLVRMFDRRIARREKNLDNDEIALFGELLHRRLFPEDSWAWVESQARGDGPVRLMLAFPADTAISSVAALPWEYLHSPGRPGRNGSFIVQDPRWVLSRVVPSGGLDDRAVHGDRIRILPVVGEWQNGGIGEFSYQEAVGAIEAAQARRPGLSMLTPLIGSSYEQLSAAVAAVDGVRPDIVHFIGHGRFRDGHGAVALRRADGETDWVDEQRLAQALCSQDWAPAVVVLHACEGGAGDFTERFAGLAPTLASAGVLSVIAMQYAVLNSTATAFSTALYNALADGRSLDDAVQRARTELWVVANDARLLGIPMIYQRAATPLLFVPEGDE